MCVGLMIFSSFGVLYRLCICRILVQVLCMIVVRPISAVASRRHLLAKTCNLSIGSAVQPTPVSFKGHAYSCFPSHSGSKKHPNQARPVLCGPLNTMSMLERLPITPIPIFFVALYAAALFAHERTLPISEWNRIDCASNNVWSFALCNDTFRVICSPSLYLSCSYTQYHQIISSV